MATNKDANVTKNLAQWDAGITLVETCKEDAACYEKTLQDVNADWFAREKAAFEVEQTPELADEVSLKSANMAKQLLASAQDRFEMVGGRIGMGSMLNSLVMTAELVTVEAL